MKKTILTALVLIVSLALTACTSGYRSTTQQADNNAYIRLSGNFLGTTMTINNEPPRHLSERTVRTFHLDGERVVLLEVSSGTQNLLITRGDTTLVHRELYVSDGNTVAVRVP